MGDEELCLPLEDEAIAPHSSTVNECECCVICFEPYTTNGDKRPSCLPCGHIFCLQCIDQWCRGAGTGSAHCPICKRRFRKKEIRCHYTRGIKAVDNTLLREKEEELRKCKERLAYTEMKLVEYEYEARMFEKKAIALANKLEVFKRSGVVEEDAEKRIPTLKKGHEMLVDGTSDPACRVMAYNGDDCSLLASCRCRAFPIMYNVVKVDLVSNRFVGQPYMASAQVRDIEFSPDRRTFAVASFDKYVRVITSAGMEVATDVLVGEWVWSCCYHREKPYLIFAGTGSGKVLMYDLRMVRSTLDHSIAVSQLCDVRRPIISLRWSNFQPSTSVPPGVVVTSLSECHFMYTTTGDNFGQFTLPFSGRLYSLVQDEETGHFLLSTGPSSMNAGCSYYFFNMSRESQEVGGSARPEYQCNVVRRFSGGSAHSILGRDSVFSYANRAGESACLAAVYNEEMRSVQLWNMNDGVQVSTLQISGNMEDHVYNILYVTTASDPLLLLLTKSRLLTYQLP